MNNSTSPTLTRHCAYCLITLLPAQVKVCGSCHRRAYCSRECQSADWSPKLFGQKHKLWCSVKCGEEDLQWEITPIKDKGLGMVALEGIPAYSKIMVDGFRPVKGCSVASRLIQDLEPKDGTFEDKIELNGFSHPNGMGVICARMARVNHDCGANALQLSDDERCAKILYSLRDIKKGEEIGIPYYMIWENRFKNESNPGYLVRLQLETKYGITCPPDCACRQEGVRELWDEHIQLSDFLRDWSRRNIPGVTQECHAQLDKLAAAVYRLLQIFESTPLLGEGPFAALIDGGYVAISRGDPSLAKKYFDRAKVIADGCYHPTSRFCQKLKVLCSNFSLVA